jgi:hypothetical protein
MGILLDLEAIKDEKVWEASEYQVQGFVYDKLIANTEFKDIPFHRSCTLSEICNI